MNEEFYQKIFDLCSKERVPFKEQIDCLCYLIAAETVCGETEIDWAKETLDSYYRILMS